MSFTYRFHFHSLRRCRTRHPSAWRHCPSGVAAISGGGLPTGWTRWRRCRRSGPSPCWFPGPRKHGCPRCPEVLLQKFGVKLAGHRLPPSSFLPKLLLYPPRPPPLPRPPRPAPRPRPGPGLRRASLRGRGSLSLSLSARQSQCQAAPRGKSSNPVASSKSALQVFSPWQPTWNTSPHPIAVTFRLSDQIQVITAHAECETPSPRATCREPDF